MAGIIDEDQAEPRWQWLAGCVASGRVGHGRPGFAHEVGLEGLEVGGACTRPPPPGYHGPELAGKTGDAGQLGEVVPIGDRYDSKQEAVLLVGCGVTAFGGKVPDEHEPPEVGLSVGPSVQSLVPGEVLAGRVYIAADGRNERGCLCHSSHRAKPMSAGRSVGTSVRENC
jgi:hypothetical protein